MITLTTAFTVSIGGVLVENDTIGACTSIVTDFLARTQTTTFMIGPLVGGVPNPSGGVQAQLQNQNIVITVHLDTGAWSDNHGHSGTIPANILAPIVTQALGDRNTAESFMAPPGGLMPGSITTWTQI